MTMEFNVLTITTYQCDLNSIPKAICRELMNVTLSVKNNVFSAILILRALIIFK